MKTDMEYKEIMELWDRFEASGITEMELEHQGTRFSLKKGMPAVSAPQVPAGSVAECKEEAQTRTHPAAQKEIRSPLAGTFYCAPAPEAEPFVKEGQQVKKGDVVGVVEAMKLMNEIQAKEDGMIEECSVKNGAMVSFGQVLFRLS